MISLGVFYYCPQKSVDNIVHGLSQKHHKPLSTQQDFLLRTKFTLHIFIINYQCVIEITNYSIDISSANMKVFLQLWISLEFVHVIFSLHLHDAGGSHASANSTAMPRPLLEQTFPLLWVAGEISNFTRATSGHWYFTLKDGQAQVRCAMFRHKSQYVDFKPENGMQVEVRALVTLYEARGEYQLSVGIHAPRRLGCTVRSVRETQGTAGAGRAVR